MVFRLMWRSFSLPAYRKRLLERFGIFSKPTFSSCIWLHAVSVGETIAAVPLVKKLQAAYPDCAVVMTSTTPTGSERVRAAFGVSVFHVYAPYDNPGSVKRFLQKVTPKIAIFMETELWPNYLYFCRQQNVPTVLANARLSDRSANRYLNVKGMAKMMMGLLTKIIAQTEMDAKNFKKIGAVDAQLVVTGSVKFDVTISDDLLQKGLALRAALGADRPVWVAASTHDGEEARLLQVHQALLKTLPNALLVLVPRHPNRFAQVGALCKEAGFGLAVRSLEEVCQPDTQVYLGDTMGELLQFYAACDLAFVGGSFVSIGGHNLLEPAALKKPVLSGPCLTNFLVIGGMLQKAGGMKVVNHPSELVAVLLDLFHDSGKASIMGEQAFAVVQANRGALDRQFAFITAVLNQ